MNLLPYDDRIIVSPEETPDKIGSIIVPETAKRESQRGRVVAIGKIGENGFDALVIIGARIIYSKYAGIEIEEDGKKYVIMRTSDIQAIYKE